MDLDNNKKISRRKFVQGAVGATFCCACFSLSCAGPSKEHSEIETESSKGKVHLAAACGTYCGACPAYIAKHGTDEQIKMRLQMKSSSGHGIPPSNWMDGLLCDGCLSGGQLAAHCQRCNIRLHALNTQNNSRCSDCGELPCNRITNLINMGGYLHRKEYLPNLKKIREMGVQEWVKYEEKRWLCQKCSMTMSWYDTECAGCGEPRSKELFSLTKYI